MDEIEGTPDIVDSRFEDLPKETLKKLNGATLLFEEDVPSHGLTGTTTRTAAYSGCNCGYYAQVGKDEDGKFVAISGLVNPSVLDAALPKSGEAKYTGYANFIAVDRESATDTIAIAEATGNSAVVRVDFGDGTFRGRTPDLGDDEYQLTFNGSIVKRALEGTVRLRKTGFDVTGPIKGVIDGEGLISVYHGNDDIDTFAGGLAAENINP